MIPINSFCLNSVVVSGGHSDRNRSPKIQTHHMKSRYATSSLVYTDQVIVVHSTQQFKISLHIILRDPGFVLILHL